MSERRKIIILGGGAGTSSSYTEVDTFADLPLGIGVVPVGTLYYVRTSTGSYFTFNKKPSGLWRKVTDTGVAGDWVEAGDLTQVLPATVTQGEAEAGTSTSPKSWTPERVAQAIAALSTSGTDLTDFSIIEWLETFAAITAGELGWRASAIGTGTVTQVANVDAPALQIRTGTTSGWGYSYSRGSSATYGVYKQDGTNVFRIKVLFKTGATITDYRLWIGMINISAAASPQDGIFLRFDTTVPDTNFRLVAAVGGAYTLGSDNLGAPSVSTWYTLDLWSTGDGVVHATINGGTESTVSSGFTTLRGTPWFQLINATAADRRVDIARMYFRHSGLVPA